METKRDYIQSIVKYTKELDSIEWDDPKRFFTPTLKTMTLDSARWIENEWKAANGATTPIEKAIVVLTQDLIVLLGHAAGSEFKHESFHALIQAAKDAVEAGIIEDQSHRDYFTHPDSPLHEMFTEEA